MKTWLVMDDQGCPTWNDKEGQSQLYTSFTNAQKAAKALAKDNPGMTITIYEATAIYESAVAPATLRML